MAKQGSYSDNSKLMHKDRRARIINGDFGDRIHPINQTPDFHTGTDYATGSGTPLTSVFNGVITVAREVSGYGGTVGIYNKENDLTYFACHMKVFNVTVGQEITVENVIGLSGGAKDDPMNGNTTGAHLHASLCKGKHSTLPSKSNRYMYLDIELFDFTNMKPSEPIKPKPKVDIYVAKMVYAL